MNEDDESEDNKRLRVNLESEYNEVVDFLSEYFGINTKAELFRFLLKREMRIAKVLSFFEDILEIENIKEKIGKILKNIIKDLEES